MFGSLRVDFRWPYGAEVLECHVQNHRSHFDTPFPFRADRRCRVCLPKSVAFFNNLPISCSVMHISGPLHRAL
jgi:hypothetical protein